MRTENKTSASGKSREEWVQFQVDVFIKVTMMDTTGEKIVGTLTERYGDQKEGDEIHTRIQDMILKEGDTPVVGGVYQTQCLSWYKGLVTSTDRVGVKLFFPADGTNEEFDWKEWKELGGETTKKPKKGKTAKS